MLKQLATLLGAQNSSNAPTSKNRVKIVPDENGIRVRPYQNNPTLGYILVEEVDVKSSSLTWKRRFRKTALIKGLVDDLKVWLSEFKGNILPGSIIEKDFLENEIPADIAREFFGDPDSEGYDERVETYVRRAGEEGIELVKDGERIFRFRFYDEYDEHESSTIKHDNSDEVREYSKIQRLAKLEETRKVLEAQQKADEEAKKKTEATVDAVVEGDQVKLD